MVFAACGGGGGEEKAPPDEAAAMAILDQVNGLMKKGQEPEAMAALETLAPYAETKTYLAAKEEWAAKGISIDDARKSWTILRMIELRNEIAKMNLDEYTRSDVAKKKLVQDAWGMPLAVEYGDGTTHYFAVVSAGPDAQFHDEDDLAVMQRVEPRRAAPPPPGPEESPGMPPGDVTPAAEPRVVEPKSEEGDKKFPELKLEKGPTGEPTLDLKDLLGK